MPHLSEILKAELERLRERVGGVADGRPALALNILETGTIRNTGEAYQVNDGWSTLTFAQDVKAHGGSYTGIDLDVSAAVEVLKARKLIKYATFMEGHSIEVLSLLLADSGDLERYDVIFLDSDNDASLILHEYLIARQMVRSPGLIMVDDVDPRSTDVVKGHGLLPRLEAHGTPYRLEIRHGDGYETGVLVIEA